MEEKKKNKIRSVYGIVFSALTVIVGIAIIVQLWRIYGSAPRKAFSRAKIAESFNQIAPLVWLWVLSLVGNAVLAFLCPVSCGKLKGGMDITVSLSGWRGRFVDEGKDLPKVRALRSIRLAACIVGGILITIAAIFGASYLFDTDYQPRFSAAIFTVHNAAADRLFAMFPWLLAAVVTGILVAYICERTRAKEIDVLKEEFAAQAKRKKSGEAEPSCPDEKTVACVAKKRERKAAWENFKKDKQKGLQIAVLAIRVGLLVAGVVLIILGIQWGGMDLVYEKARSICQQCIGLG